MVSRILVAVLLVMPVMASAQTIEELQAQANALLQKIQELQQQLATTPGTSGTGLVVDSSSCPLIGRVLSVGSTGSDVTRLQQFLARDASIYPERLVTGYYGPLTQAAVQRWQARFNIVSSGTPASTGFGQVGPRTAASMSLQCSTYGGSGSATVGGFIRVTPISGNAPLTVNVETTVNTVNSCTTATYTVDYGDGTAQSLVTVPPGSCNQMVRTFTHIYQTSGTYLVTLSAGSHRTSATVVVTGTTGTQTNTVSDSLAATPSTGEAPLVVTFNGVINGSLSCGGGEYTLTFGDGPSTTLPYSSQCQSFTYSVTHQYSSGGTFTARLYRGTQTSYIAALTSVTVNESTVPYTIVSVSPAVGGNVFASSVQISYPACKAYSFNWGDGTSPTTVSATSGCTFGDTSTVTLSHTYSNSGSYTVSLKDGGDVVRSTASIVIAD